MHPSTSRGEVFETDVPARLDRLPWARFHWLVVAALGITWILDGLEVTLVGSLSPTIAGSPVMRLTAQQVGYSASAYLAGAVGGALLFGWLTDRLGRKKLFTITVLVYLLGTIATGFSWDVWSFAFCRIVTGAGIGGEYAAVNATIQELIPARRRGFTDLVINGSFWVGAAIGALGAVVVLDPAVVSWIAAALGPLAGGLGLDPAVMRADWGWRLAFLIGGVIGLIVLYVRRYIPESPRWLMTHGRPEEASRIVQGIEDRIVAETGRPLPDIPPGLLRLRRHNGGWFLRSLRVLVRDYPERTVLGLAMMASQAFCYNAVFFTYALVLTQFYGVASANVGLFMLPFALGNFMGPLVLGRLFDTIGRRVMIVATYGLSGVLMAIVGLLFVTETLGAVGQTIGWTVIFFFASAAASSAYLTVGENFPLEVRAVAISAFYAFGTGLGGIAGPALFGWLIASGSRQEVMWGYMLGAGLMVGAALVAYWLAVDSERKPLESVAPPLSAA